MMGILKNIFLTYIFLNFLHLLKKKIFVKIIFFKFIIKTFLEQETSMDPLALTVKLPYEWAKKSNVNRPGEVPLILAVSVGTKNDLQASEVLGVEHPSW